MSDIVIDTIAKSNFTMHPISDTRYEDEEEFGYIILEKSEGWNRKEINKVLKNIKFETEVEYIRDGEYWQINIYI